MRKLILIAHISLDGFVAGENGGFEGFDQSPENLEFVCSLTDTADAALAGRVSYEMLESAWPTAKDKPNASKSEIKYSNWYNDAEKIVLSRTLPKTDSPKTTILSDNIKQEIGRIKEQRGKDILMFGSPTALQTLSELNLIDEHWLIVYPTLFGKGIPLFSHNEAGRKLKLVHTIQLSRGEIALHYKQGE